MGNKHDGNKMPSASLVDIISNNIKLLEEKGNFAPKEQEQFLSVMQTIKLSGGLNKLDDGSLKELEHIVKVLGSDGDKSVMIKNEISEFVSSIAKGKHI